MRVGLQFSYLTMVCERKDFRVPIVLDDVQKSVFENMKITQTGKIKDIHQNNTKDIVVK